MFIAVVPSHNDSDDENKFPELSQRGLCGDGGLEFVDKGRLEESFVVATSHPKASRGGVCFAALFVLFETSNKDDGELGVLVGWLLIEK